MRSFVAGIFVVGLAACGGEPLSELPYDEQRIGEVAYGLSVDEAVSSGCSTKQVEGLSLQIIAQGNCNAPGAFSELSPPSNVNLGSAVLPYLEEPARDALLSALNQNAGTQMQINSMLRTVAQQYLLYRWYQLGQCGIGLAATPGSSNHETGLAIDIQQYSTWRPTLEAKGFKWLGSNDPVHFDYVGPGAVNHLGLDVLSFQQLWNINHPEDPIAEDGAYGPQTEARLKQSPAEGFPLGADCGEPDPPPTMGDDDVTAKIAFTDASDVFADGPSAGVVDVVVGRPFGLAIRLENEGQAASDPIEIQVSLDEAFAITGYRIDDEPAGVTPELTFTISAGAIAAGEKVTIVLELIGAIYTADREMPPTITVKIPGLGTTELSADVYSDRFFTWDGARLEGWTSAADLAVDEEAGALTLESATAPLFADSPALDVPVSDIIALTLTASRDADSDGPAVLLVAADGADWDDALHIALDLPNDGAAYAISLDSAVLAGIGDRVTGLRFSPFDGDPGAATLHALSLDTEVPLGIPGDNAGCACRAAPSPSGSWPFLALLGLAQLLRRRLGDFRAR
jgi:MYXO-CTERM domain-containing protein